MKLNDMRKAIIVIPLLLNSSLLYSRLLLRLGCFVLGTALIYIFLHTIGWFFFPTFPKWFAVFRIGFFAGILNTLSHFFGAQMLFREKGLGRGFYLVLLAFKFGVLVIFLVLNFGTLGVEDITAFSAGYAVQVLLSPVLMIITERLPKRLWPTDLTIQSS